MTSPYNWLLMIKGSLYSVRRVWNTYTVSVSQNAVQKQLYIVYAIRGPNVCHYSLFSRAHDIVCYHIFVRLLANSMHGDWTRYVSQEYSLTGKWDYHSSAKCSKWFCRNVYHSSVISFSKGLNNSLGWLQVQRILSKGCLRYQVTNPVVLKGHWQSIPHRC